jgi:hypothetical protein
MSAAHRPPGENDASATTCAVCGGTEDDPRLLASCYGCRRTFHLNPYAAPGTDCGDVWAGSDPDHEFTGLELYCSRCLVRGSGASASGEAGADTAVLRGVEALARGAAPRGKSEPPLRTPRPRWRRRYRRLDTGER